MAFINEFMTEEEKSEFEARKIPNPGNSLYTLSPYKWTIDRDEDIFLIWGLEEREDDRDKSHFLFCWKGINIPVFVRESWDENSIHIWSLIRINIPTQYTEKTDEIMQSVREAFLVYAFNGVPDDLRNKATEYQKINF